jgi:hypothetical protein
MSAQAFADGIRALLTDDATFTDAIAALIGAAPGVLRGNVPFSAIPAGSYPCWVLEQGDGKAQTSSEGGDTFLTIGTRESSFQSDLGVALVWKNNDREIAADHREQLPKIFAQLLLRNPQPGGITAAWLEGWTPDRAALHPTQLWVATLRGLYSITA